MHRSYSLSPYVVTSNFTIQFESSALSLRSAFRIHFHDTRCLTVALNLRVFVCLPKFTGKTLYCLRIILGTCLKLVVVDDITPGDLSTLNDTYTYLNFKHSQRKHFSIILDLYLGLFYANGRGSTTL